MKRTLVLSALTLASTLVLAACGEATEPGDTDSTTTATETVASAPTTTESTEVTEATDTTIAEAEGEIAVEHNNTDIMFARMMIPHHRQAVEMSGILLTGDDVPAEVADFAQRIVDTQTAEIEQMDSMLEVWGQ